MESDDPFDPELLIKELDIARRTVESLDRSMVRIRQLYLIVISIIVAGVANLTAGQDIHMIFPVVQLSSILFITFSLILWGMDTHYHEYLRETIQTTCVNLENRLGFTEESGLGTTNNLERRRNNREGGKILPTLLYFTPNLFALIGLSLFTGIWGIQVAIDGLYLTGLTLTTFLAGLTYLWLRIIFFHFQSDKS